MKKKLLTILLSVFMMLGTFVNVVHADITTVQDLLNEYSASYLMAGSGNRFTKGDAFILISDGFFSYGVVDPGADYSQAKINAISVTQDPNNPNIYVADCLSYKATSDNIHYVFTIKNNKLFSIEVSEYTNSSYTVLNGTYYAVTIADVLATNPDFPKTGSSAWLNNAGKKAYSSGNLVIAGAGYPGSFVVQKNASGNYEFTNSGITITFVMESNKLVKITVTGHWDKDCNGEYLPIENEGYSIDYVNEKVTIDDGYEISKTNNPFIAESLTNKQLSIEPNTTYYIRKEAVSYAFTTPVRPGRVVGVEAHQESIMKKDDASLRGVTETMEYSVSCDSGTYGSWLNGSGTSIGFVFDITPNPITRYDVKVRYKATTNSFAGEETIYTFLPNTTDKITVTMGETILKVAYGDKLNKPVDPTKEDYTFGGWYYDEECKYAYNFAEDIITEDTTLYPKWIKNSDNPITTETAKITGDSIDINKVKVELYKGKELTVSTQTDENGNYDLGNILPGDYNLVITKGYKVTTSLVHIEGSTVPQVAIPNKNVSSVVQHDFAIDGTKSNSDEIVVGGLDTIANAQNPGTGESITIKLMIEPKEDYDEDAQKDIKKVAGSNKHIEFIDFSLTKAVDEGMPTNIGDGNNTLLTIVIPFDFTNVDVSSVMIVRKHGDNTSKLTTSPNDSGEYIVVNKDEGTITLKAKKFSVYAIAYSNKGSSPTPGYIPPNTGVDELSTNNHSLLKLSSLSLLAIGTYMAIKKKKDNE